MTTPVFDALAVLESLPSSVIVTGSDGTLHFANAAARQLAAVISPDPAEGLRLLTLHAPELWAGGDGEEEDANGREDRVTCGADADTGLKVLRQWRTSASQPEIASVTLRPARGGDGDLPQAAADHDRRMAEQQNLVHAEKLATVGQLAAGMAHEINNPICYVQSNLGSLREYLNKLFGLIESFEELMRDEQLSIEQRLSLIAERKRIAEYSLIVADLPMLLEECLEGVERIRNIVQNLRDFSRTDAAEGFRLFDIHRAIDTTLSIVRTLAGGSTLFSTYFENLPLIECNPTELNQVLMNILVNATQAVGRNGLIEIHTGVEEEKVWVEIRDNGSGIDEHALPHIFEPFFTTKEVGQGTGLGLSISHGIIKKHGGEITVKSRPALGTTFRITLPCRQ